MPIEVERDGGIWTITINRPERRNALDLPHFQMLAGAWVSPAAADTAAEQRPATASVPAGFAPPGTSAPRPR